MMRALTLALAGLAAAPAPASAQAVVDCLYGASPEAVSDLLDVYSADFRSFANGEVLLYLVDQPFNEDTGRYSLVLLWETGGEAMACAQIEPVAGFGFTFVGWEGLSAAYDPALGLLWDVNVRSIDTGSADGWEERWSLGFSLNRATQEVTASQTLAD